MSAQTAFLIFITLMLLAVLVGRNRNRPSGADAAITAAVTKAIDAELSGDSPFANSRVDVKTFDGVVILGGFVREFALAKRAVEIARATPGVKSVDNRISVRTGG